MLKQLQPSLKAEMFFLPLSFISQEKFSPVKYFSIDRVFRNETLDATHLAEFHQIEGVVADYGLTLGDLMGVLHQFFTKLGHSSVLDFPFCLSYLYHHIVDIKGNSRWLAAIINKFVLCHKCCWRYSNVIFISFFLGIAKLRFKPAYNPYTEPSMEVFSYHEGITILFSKSRCDRLGY